MILDDGTVIPSYLGVQTRGEDTGSRMALNDNVLRLGEIKKIVLPSDSSSFTKKVTEYEIDVQYRDGSGAITTSLYRGCIVNNLFGGVADLFSYTLRENTSPNKKDGKVFGIGSKVLILCVSGGQNRAVILGGIRDVQLEQQAYDGDKGHNFYFEFNGIRFQVNDDGEATATFRGKTKYDGTLADSANADAEGTTINLNKDGNIELSTPSEAQFIRLNHKDKKIEILADTEWNVEVNGKLVFKTGKDANITVGGQTTLDSTKDVIIKSTGVKVGDATDAWVKGTTYRDAEKQMHSKIESMLNNVQIQLSIAATLNSIPTVGGGLAATNFSTAATLLGQVASAIQTFEGSADTYLSKKNTTD